MPMQRMSAEPLLTSPHDSLASPSRTHRKREIMTSFDMPHCLGGRCDHAQVASGETTDSAAAGSGCDGRHQVVCMEQRMDYRAIQVQHESLARLHSTLVEASPSSVVSIDSERRITSFNPAAERLTGQRAADVIGSQVTAMVASLSRAWIETALDNVLSGETGTETELPLALVGGKRVIARVSAAPLRDAAGGVFGAMFVLLDVTEQRRLARIDRRNERRIRSMTAQMAMALDRERRDIAIGLHDSVGQNLAALSVALGRLSVAVKDDPATAQSVQQARMLLKQTIAAARSFTFELSPPILNELGLAAALEWLVEREAAQAPGVWRFRGDHIELGREAASLLYRSARELIRNAARHADAEQVEVRLFTSGCDAVVRVMDDGNGVDVEELGRRRDTLGLFSVNEQLARFGGRLVLRSDAKRGTVAEAHLPVRRDDQPRCRKAQ